MTIEASPISKLLLPRRSRNAGLGSEKLIYFERLRDGHLIIPPVVNAPLPTCRLPQGHDRNNPNCLCGYVRREANSVRELEAVSKRKEAQRQADFARIDEVHVRRMEAKTAEIRRRLHHRMQETHSQFEKDFIRGALKQLEAGEKNWRPRKIEGHFHIEEG
jgi:hypothetical protein